MSLSSSILVFVYLIQLLLLSLALGSWTVHQPRLFMVPRLSRFLIGFCVTPFLLGGWMLLPAAILPGASMWLFLLPPLVAAIALLALYGSRTLRRLTRDYRRTHRLSRNPWVVYFIYICAAVVIAVVIPKLVINGQPSFAHDSLIYMGKALSFAQERSVSVVYGIKDSPDGSLRGSSHSFLFPAFLSHALMTRSEKSLGYPYDQAAWVAFQITIVYMLLSVVALSGMTRYLGAGALALILLLQVPQFEYNSIAGGRDPFRIIPLMLLATTLAGFSSSKLRYHKLRPASLLPPLVLAMFSLAGHTLDGFVVIMIALGWLIWGLRQKIHWLTLLLVLAAIGTGLLFESFRYVEAYLETGRFYGDAFSDYMLQGTPLEEIRFQQDSARIAYQFTTLQRLAWLLELDQYRLSVPGLLGAILALAWWPRFQSKKQTKSIPFIGLVVLTISLPFIGIFDLTGYALSRTFVGNWRYVLHWYPFAAVGVAVLASYWYNVWQSHPNRRLRVLATVTLVLATTAVSFSSYKIVIEKWRTNTLNEETIVETIASFKAAIDQLPARQRMLLEDGRYNYYLDNQAVVMFSRPTSNIIQAKNEDEVQKALKALDIGAVALLERNIVGWWDQTPLFSFLNNPDKAFVTDSHERYRVYIVDETLVYQHNLPLRQARAYLAKARFYYQQGQLEESFTAYQQAEASSPVVIAELTAAEQKFIGAMRVERMMKDVLDFVEIVAEDDQPYALTKMGHKQLIGGPERLADGPIAGSKAVVIDETTKLMGPTEAIDLSQGSLSIWGRLTNPEKLYSDLVRLNSNNDLYIYHEGRVGRFYVLYNGVRVGISSVTITDDQWHHYVLTWQDGQQKFYIDGQETLSGEIPASTVGTRSFAIGWLGDREGEAWGGLLANLVTFNRPLADNQVRALYWAGPTAGRYTQEVQPESAASTIDTPRQ